jgi:hypothetical protein
MAHTVFIEFRTVRHSSSVRPRSAFMTYSDATFASSSVSLDFRFRRVYFANNVSGLRPNNWKS